MSAPDLERIKRNHAAVTAVATFTILDDDLALDVAANFHNHIVYNGLMGWMEYGPGYWSRITEVRAFGACGDALRDIYAIREPYVLDLLDDKARLEQLKLLARLKNTSLHTAVFKKLKSLVELPGNPWDRDGLLLCAPNCVIDLKHGMKLSHRPDFYMTRCVAVNYEPDAWREEDGTKDRWTEGLAAWNEALSALPDDVYFWFQSRIGQALSAVAQPEHEMIICVGSGRNSKSLIFNAIKSATKDAFTVVPPKLLLGNASDHPTDMMTLRGARIAFIEELPEGKHLNVQRLKSIVGTDTISGRYMGQDFTDFPATHSLFVTTNYTPQIAETDDGTWRRLVLLRFPYHFVKPGAPLVSADDRPGDPTLASRLSTVEALEVILAWAVAGFPDYYAGQNHDLPESVERDTLQWREETDSILRYVNEHLEFDPDSMIEAKDLFRHFKAQQVAEERGKWSAELFGGRFKDHEIVKNHGVDKVQVRKLDGLSRPPVSDHYSALPNPPIEAVKPWVWRGLRFIPTASSGGQSADPLESVLGVLP
jgi:putative DNA primase/helicase